MFSFINITSILSLFSENFYVTYHIDILLFYFVVVINFFLLLAVKKIYINKEHVLLLMFLLSINLISLLGVTTTPWLVAKQIIGISIVSFYYYSFFRSQDHRLNYLFHMYCKFAYYIAIIGIIMFVFHYITRGYFLRLESIFREPAHYVTVIFPAFYFYLKNYLEYKIYKVRTFVIFISIVLAGSSVGFVGLLFSWLLIYKPNFRNMIKAMAFFLITLFLIFNLSSDFKDRAESTIYLLVTQDFTKANVSSFALISNLFVALKSFSNHWLIGGGLGSHEISYFKYIYSVGFNIDALKDPTIIGLNYNDACSLFIRILSEIGLVGIVFVFFFIVKYRIKTPCMEKNISDGILIYFLLKLLREGHYFSPEMYFFVCLYYFLYQRYKKKKQLEAAK
jgi:hypothetical protein